MRQQYQQEAFGGGGTTIVRKRLGFLSILAISVAGVVMTIIVCVSALAFRGLAIVDRKADTLTGLATDLVKALPEYREALPPALADAIDDERRPEYLEDLAISARIVEADSNGRTRGIVEVTNKGDEIVSLLSLRVVGLDKGEEPVWEHSTWAATPIQIDHDWRGPLMPGSTRRIPIQMRRSERAATMSCEVTDVRVWKGARSADALTVAKN
ncbi:MAG TPA: hypothetical protein P5081_09275 [Phycisphaerae bacterium]|nr:hypothetical protein [Phycisphaerae bacterium]HRW53068.1 hypothetical protein [Phycisphaerae bacterium]